MFGLVRKGDGARSRSAGVCSDVYRVKTGAEMGGVAEVVSDYDGATISDAEVRIDVLGRGACGFYANRCFGVL